MICEGKIVFSFRGSIDADMFLFFRLRTTCQKALILQSKKNTELIIVVGEVGEPGNTTINVVGERSAMFDCGYVDYHGPLTISNMFLQQTQRRMRYSSPRSATACYLRSQQRCREFRQILEYV